ncbi:ATP-binding protein [Comamonas sp. 26]|uniref:ATP-binding protein n=1 Tax=Comamonas sp. 26 TaxID=2035201 RepID=UPI000C1784D8|nr:ATP-binding protein [Comamonas sp. 26]PIF98480.1 AAA domain-containing protein [Comamonas sp. 26]
MNNAQELRQAIEHCVIQHPEFRKHADSLQQRIDDAIAGYSPRIEWLIGPPQVGKHVLCNMLSRQYPSQRINGKLQIPVLAANLPSSITPEMLPTMLLSKLGQPLPQKTSENDVMFKRLCDWLHLAGTKVVIFENASYLVNPRARMQPLGAGDWFKSLVHITGVTVVLMGLPRLEQLFTCNPELRSSAAEAIFRHHTGCLSAAFQRTPWCTGPDKRPCGAKLQTFGSGRQADGRLARPAYQGHCSGGMRASNYALRHKRRDLRGFTRRDFPYPGRPPRLD